MLLETDRRAFHRNMFTRAKLLPPAQREECARLVDRIETSVRANDRAAMRDLHIEMHQRICELARAAFARYGLEFPPRVESEMVAFYKREWPM
jgi:DNA-binding GntR family transcriptional regulator